MVILQLPSAATAEQLQYTVSILEKYVHRHQKGVQVLCSKEFIGSVQKQQEFSSLIKQYLPPHYINTFHASISPHAFDEQLSLLSPASVPYYRSLADIVQRAGGSVLVLHCNAVFRPDQWTLPYTEYNYVQKTYYGTVLDHLRKISERMPLAITVENMPFPLRGDKITDPDNTPYDPFLITVEQITDFLQNVPSNVFLAFDTSHYGIASQKINYLWKKYGPKITLENINQEGLKGVYPQLIRQQPTIIKAFELLQRTNRIAHVQLADHQGTWYPAKAGFTAEVFKEGYPVGEGDLKEELLELVKLIAKKDQHIPISIDVEVKDFLQRDEQIKSLQHVLAILQ